MVLWDEIGLCRRTIFQAPKKCFFPHMLGLLPIHAKNLNMWIDVGTWNIVFPNNLKKTEALQKNNFSSSEMFFFRTCLDCFQSDLEHCLPNNSVKRATPTQASHPDGPLHQENDILTDPVRCLKSHSPGVEPPPWRHWPLRYRSLAFNDFCFLILSLFALAAKGWV